MSRAQSNRNPVGYSPEECAHLLATAKPLLLVGGQAVNLWALYYRQCTGDLAPFVSRDIDVLGSRETLRQIAEAAGAEPQYFPMRPPTNEVGVVTARDNKGHPLPVEVLSHVYGISNDDLCKPTYTVAVGHDAVRVRIPGPIALLQAKLANAADLSQAGRQDLRHVRILSRLMPAYFQDLQGSVAARRLTERDMVNLLERLLAIVKKLKTRQILQELDIDPRNMFSGLNSAPGTKMKAFLTNRLPRELPENGN